MIKPSPLLPQFLTCVQPSVGPISSPHSIPYNWPNQLSLEASTLTQSRLFVHPFLTHSPATPRGRDAIINGRF